MTAILSPKPRRASYRPQQPAERVLPLLSPPVYVPGDMTRSTGPPRLMSPVNLTGPALHKPNLSKSSASCSSSKRRRSHTSSTRVSRRRRTDCPPTFSSNVFDALPWIAQVERAPQRVDIWDLADLSLLPDDSPHPSSGAGPIRRRRTSSRSGVPPLGGGTATEAAASGRGAFPHRVPASHAKRDGGGGDDERLPMQLLPAFDRESCDPRTPPPSYSLDPRDVTFDRLMPILPTFDPALRLSPRDTIWSRSSTPSPL